MIQRNERRAFEDFCVALQKYPRPLTELGKGQRFVNKRHHNQWSISRAGQYLLAQGAVVHRFRVHYGNIPMEPMLTVVHVHVGREKSTNMSTNMRTGTYFNEQVATAARGTFGRAFEGKGKWSPRLW